MYNRGCDISAIFWVECHCFVTRDSVTPQSTSVISQDSTLDLWSQGPRITSVWGTLHTPWPPICHPSVSSPEPPTRQNFQCLHSERSSVSLWGDYHASLFTQKFFWKDNWALDFTSFSSCVTISNLFLVTFIHKIFERFRVINQSINTESPKHSLGMLICLKVHWSPICTGFPYSFILQCQARHWCQPGSGYWHRLVFLSPTRNWEWPLLLSPVPGSRLVDSESFPQPSDSVQAMSGRTFIASHHPLVII